MKNSKKTMKLILMVLICISIILVGFFGIYVKQNNSYANSLPKYILASDLKGATTLEFEVNNGTEKVYYDKDGKKVDATTVTDENKSDYREEEVAINANENLTADNYQKVVDIMKKRLQFLKADQYRLDLDEKSGKIILTFEDEYPSDIKSILPMEGKLELIDSNSNEQILNETDFSSVEASYASVEEGYTTYISLKLKNSGIEKVNNLDKYRTTTNSETGETTTNKFKIMFDEDQIAEISYDDLLLTGKTLRLTTNSKLTSNSSINSEMNTNSVVSKLATIGKMPVVYKLSAEEYVQSDAVSYINYIVIAISTICAVIAVYFIIRYKLNGLLALLGFAANSSLFLILIRLTKIPVSLNGFAGMVGLVVLNTILINNLLKAVQNKDKNFSENIKSAYLKTIDVLVIALIIFAVFSFSAMTVISSMGLLVFWGWLVVVLGNLLLTVPMLWAVNK